MKNTFLFITGLLLLSSSSACNSKNSTEKTVAKEDNTSENTTGSDKDVLSWEAFTNNEYWNLNSADKSVFVSVKVTGNVKKTEKKRVPLNISLVLDRSGSMSGDAIKFARDAAKFVVEQLSSEDILSIVNYDDAVEVTSPSQPVKNKEILIKKIDEINSRGWTNLSGGSLEGYKQVASTKSSNYVNRVLLLTDGLANKGITEPERLNKIASGKFGEEGIALSTFGLGAEYDEDLLTQMAESGRGNYYYIDKTDKIPEIFAKELDGLLNVVAQNTTVSIELPSGVKCEKVYGYPYTQEGNKIIVALNDIFSKEDKVFLLKVKLIDKNIEKLDFPVEMTYIDADNFAANTKKKNLKVLGTSDKELVTNHKNTKVEELIALFEATDTFDLILSDVDKNNYDTAKKNAESAILRLQEVQKEIPSEDLQKQEQKMKEYLDSMEEVKEMEREEKMIYQKSNKSENYSVKKRKK